MTPRADRPLLLFNLATDADDPVLGFTSAWANALAAYFPRVDVMTMRAGRLATADNVRVYSIGKEKGYSEPRRALEFYRRLSSLLLRERYAAAFAHMTPLFAVLAALPLCARGVPLTLWYTHGAVSRTLRLAERVVGRVVTASPESFRLASPKVRVLGHGIDTDQFAPAARPAAGNARFTVLSVGRIAPVKRLETLVEAANRLYHGLELRDLRVRIVGEAAPEDAGYAEGLRRQVTLLGLEAVVTFAGPRPYDQVADEYRRADVMVNLSRTGSLDKAVLEAMACGTPVVTANEAFAAVLAPWADRLLIPHDAPGKLAAALVRLKRLPDDERAVLGAALRARVVADHSLPRLMERLVNVLLTGEPEAGA